MSGIRQTAWTEACSSTSSFSVEVTLKTNDEPEPWELFQREIEVSLSRIFSLESVREKSVSQEARLKPRFGIARP